MEETRPATGVHVVSLFSWQALGAVAMVVVDSSGAALQRIAASSTQVRVLHCWLALLHWPVGFALQSPHLYVLSRQ